MKRALHFVRVTFTLQDLVARLERLLPELREGRHTDDFANDVFEAVDDLLDLSRRILAADTRTNYPVRVSQEQELWRKLNVVLQVRPIEDVLRYQPIFDIAKQILLMAQDIETPKDGHLGFLKAVRERFSFLQTDYGFRVEREEPVSIRFSSGNLYVELAWAKQVSSSCSFGPESDPTRMFWIDDLLYFYGDERYKSLPDELALDTQDAIVQWLAFLKGIFVQYGHDVLCGLPGIFDELAAAQEARDRENSSELDRRWCDI